MGILEPIGSLSMLCRERVDGNKSSVEVVPVVIPTTHTRGAHDNSRAQTKEVPCPQHLPRIDNDERRASNGAYPHKHQRASFKRLHLLGFVLGPRDALGEFDPRGDDEDGDGE